MQLVQVLHMSGGFGESSYANNSLFQKIVLSIAKPIRDEAITKLYHDKFPPKLAIADLGCSSGPNTLLVLSELIEKVDEICKKLGSKFPECQVSLNDLPGNDFNTIFKTLPKFKEELRKTLGSEVEQCYFSGVPGSFYGRLFPSESLHFLHSSNSLHWLSQVPQGLESNKENICVATTSPSDVREAYHQQFVADFSMFLKCRSIELVKGGYAVLTFLGRESDEPSKTDIFYVYELLGIAIKEIVSQGLIEKEKMNSFNLPLYAPTACEVKSEILKEGSFEINHLEFSKIDSSIYNDHLEAHHDQLTNSSNIIVKHLKVVFESLLISHFGEAIVDEVFNQFSKIIMNHMLKQKLAVSIVTASMTKVTE